MGVLDRTCDTPETTGGEMARAERNDDDGCPGGKDRILKGHQYGIQSKAT